MIPPDNAGGFALEIAAAYLEVAGSLYDGRLAPDALPTAAASLPPLTLPLLNHLHQQAQEASLTYPRRGWAIAAVAEAVARRGQDDFLSGMAAWMLAGAANRWVQPHLVETAVAHARQHFARLNEPGWLAACEWQLNAHPWTRPNFEQAVQALTTALAQLEKAGLIYLLPECNLSLAYAHLLIGNFDAAKAALDASQEQFTAREDLLGRGRCLLTRASYLRRQSRFQKARQRLQQASAIFQEYHAPVYVALADFQLAFLALLEKGDFQAAENQFLQACEQFISADLPLWQAQCYGGLAEIYILSGRLGEADKAFTQARAIYAGYDALGVSADMALDHGHLEKLRGNYETSIDYFTQAEERYRKLGNKWMPYVARMNQGDVLALMGRLQRALTILEEAHQKFQAMELFQRAAECEIRLAAVWRQLGQFARANACLDAALANHRATGRTSRLPRIHNLRAEVYFKEGQSSAAVQQLRQTLAAAQEQGSRQDVALAHRLLGEALARLDQLEEAGQHLQAASAGFQQIGMVMEQAACSVAWGYYYARQHRWPEARAAWLNALDVTQQTMPDVGWPAHAGLAEFHQQMGNGAAALAHFRSAVHYLAQPRRELWQPLLAGSYLRQPGKTLDQAVALATQLGAAADALHFIEMSKAHTLTYQFHQPAARQNGDSRSTRVADLAAEIRWLQDKLRARFQAHQRAFSSAEETALRQQLLEKVKAYETEKERLERAQVDSQNMAPVFEDRFDLDRLRHLASQHLGQRWMAIDYYLTPTELHAVVVTADHTDCWQRPIPNAARFVLKRLGKPGKSGPAIDSRHLAALGGWLLPPSVQAQLTADTTLIIAPHRQLHGAPWPALELPETKGLLVTTAVPIIVPSLHNLCLLWQRAPAAGARQENGLLLSVPDFQGRWPPLPAVNQEARTLAPFLGPHSRQLHAAEATWGNLQQLKQADGLAPFAFWHVASHAFHDRITGYLSGISLYDRDVWLDELWDLAPLPSLVTLSACSGTQSLVYEGDEHVGLATTCLAAGAQTVIGSLWPIVDHANVALIRDFYAHYLAGKPAALALALAQRQASQSGRPDQPDWRSFICIGQP